MSALQFQRQLGISGYETAFVLLHKLRAAMVQPDRDKIGGEHIVEVDEAEVGGDPDLAEVALPLIHLVFSNLKAWLFGTHHGVRHQHLQAYLNEFVFRFNRRFYPMGMFNSVLGIAATSQGPTYQALYAGKWKHPNL